MRFLPLAVLLSSACVTSSSPFDASASDAPASDAPAIDAPVIDAFSPDAQLPDTTVEDVGVPDGRVDVGSGVSGRHLLLIHWPYGLGGWEPVRDGDHFALGPALEGVPTEDMAILTNVRSAPPTPIEDTHVDVPPTLWTGVAARGDDGLTVALHDSLDVMISRRAGEELVTTRVGAIEPRAALSWTAASGPTEYVRDARVVDTIAPCSRYAPHTNATTLRGMLLEAYEVFRFTGAAFSEGCRNVVSLQFASTGVQVEGEGSLVEIMHSGTEEQVFQVTQALGGWLATILPPILENAIAADTLVVLTTEIGGNTPASHDFRRLPIMMWSRIPGFQPGWIDTDGRPVSDWLRTVALQFGVDAPFAADGDEPGQVIEELFDGAAGR